MVTGSQNWALQPNEYMKLKPMNLDGVRLNNYCLLRWPWINEKTATANMLRGTKGRLLSVECILSRFTV